MEYLEWLIYHLGSSSASLIYQWQFKQIQSMFSLGLQWLLWLLCLAALPTLPESTGLPLLNLLWSQGTFASQNCRHSVFHMIPKIKILLKRGRWGVLSNTARLWFLKISRPRKLISQLQDIHFLPTVLYGTLLPTRDSGKELFSPVVSSCTIYPCSHKLSLCDYWSFTVKNNPS